MSVTTSAHRRSSFQPEYTLFTLILLACCRRREAERDLGILNSPTYGPPHLASVLTSILPKDFHPGPPGLFRSPCHGDRALIGRPLRRSLRPRPRSLRSHRPSRPDPRRSRRARLSHRRLRPVRLRVQPQGGPRREARPRWRGLHEPTGQGAHSVGTSRDVR